MRKDLVNVIFGDSIAYGIDDFDSYGWAIRIRRMLDDYNIKNYLFNLGIPGQSSIDIVNRFEYELKSRYNEEDDFYLIYAFGIKDALLLNQDKNHINVFRKNILKIISVSKRYTDNIYILGLLDVDLDKRSEYNQDNINIIDELLEEICADKKVNYISMKNIVDIEELTDGLHPNDRGHKEISDYLFEKIYK